MAEMPVQMKLGRLASRLVHNIDRDENLLKGSESDNAGQERTRTLRSGKKSIQG